MTEPPELDELVRRYLDLWQQQLSAWAQDPALARQWAALMSQATRWPGFAPDGAAGGAPGPVGPPAAGAAPDGGGGDLDGIAQRLADLERRLDRLESGPRPRNPKLGGTARKRKS